MERVSLCSFKHLGKLDDFQIFSHFKVYDYVLENII